jgi:hypothetical protein
MQIPAHFKASSLHAFRCCHIGRAVSSGFLALLLVLCASTGLGPALAQTGTKAGDLFLLAGTPSYQNGVVYPVTLYNVDVHQRLKLTRQIVPPVPRYPLFVGGLAAVVDDMEDSLYIVYPSAKATTACVLHKTRPTADDRVKFIPDGSTIDGTMFGAVVGEAGVSYLLARLLRQNPEPPYGALSSLVTVASNPPADGVRVAVNQFSNYQSFRYQGSPGGPAAQEFVPAGTARQGYVVLPGEGMGQEAMWPIDTVPPSLPAAQGRPPWPTIFVLASTDRFLVCALTPLGSDYYGLTGASASSVYVHDRRLNTWKEIKSAITVPCARRVFGSWLATNVEMYPRGEGIPHIIGRENESKDRTELLPDIRQLYPLAAAREISIPGTLLLDNLEDGRRITLDTGQEDSEILTVRADGLVLYRVNDSIFSAQINGNKLTKPSLVVKDQDVPEVHWVFWSSAASHLQR